MVGELDVESFIDQAQELGLYVIVRPGPYICAEWEFGGLPAWLLSDHRMKVRSSYSGFLTAVQDYFSVLLPKLAAKQFSYGGPIVAFQIENEYYAYGRDVEYLRALKDLFTEMGLVELLFVSDGPKDLIKMNTSTILSGVLATVNEQVTKMLKHRLMVESWGHKV
uniref:Glycoside hydrolase 35 catalytic domain-containing protein n=1 Tax=Romanomermis culicivorax TaxID=13658 RepID=A0A915JTV8_ROMCU